MVYSEMGRSVVDIDGQRRRATYSVITDEIKLNGGYAVESYGLRIAVGKDRENCLRYITFSRGTAEAACRELIRNHVGPNAFDEEAKQLIER